MLTRRRLLLLLFIMAVVLSVFVTPPTAPLSAQGSSLCAADVSMLNGQGRFSLTGLGRFSLTGLEGADTTLDPSDGVPQQLIDEVMNNPIDATWLDQFFTPFREGKVTLPPDDTYIVVIDDFSDDTLTLEELHGELPQDWGWQIEVYYQTNPGYFDEFPVLTHGDMVWQVLSDLQGVIGTQGVPSLNALAGKIHLRPVDISVGGSYELDLIVPRLERTMNILQESTGANRFVLNMSFGLVPCDDPGNRIYPPFHFADFIRVRNENPRWVFDVDGHMTINNEPVIRPAVYNGYGLIDYLMDTYRYSEGQALGHLAYLFDVAATDGAFADLSALLQFYLDQSANRSKVVIPIAASGNFADILPVKPLQPASLRQVIAVGATLGMGTNRWGYSQPAHMLTPGAWYNLYMADSFVAGTSFSAPYASMLAAMFAAYPESCNFPAGETGALPPLRDFNYSNDVLSASTVPFDCQFPGVNPPQSVQLLKNPGFETGGRTPQLAAAWTPSKLVGDQRICNTRAVFAGRCAFLFTGDLRVTSQISQRVTGSPFVALAGNNITFSAWVRARQLKGALVRVILTYADGTTAHLNLGRLNGATYPYTLFSAGTTAAMNVKDVKVIIRMTNGSGSMWIDQVKVVVTP